MGHQHRRQRRDQQQDDDARLGEHEVGRGNAAPGGVRRRGWLPGVARRLRPRRSSGRRACQVMLISTTTIDQTAEAPATWSVWMIQSGAATGTPAAEAETGTPLTMPFWIDWSTRDGPTTTATAPMVIWASTMTTRLYATRIMAGGRPGVLRRLPGGPADQAGHDEAEQSMGEVEVHEAAAAERRDLAVAEREAATDPAGPERPREPADDQQQVRHDRQRQHQPPVAVQARRAGAGTREWSVLGNGQPAVRRHPRRDVHPEHERQDDEGEAEVDHHHQRRRLQPDDPGAEQDLGGQDDRHGRGRDHDVADAAWPRPRPRRPSPASASRPARRNPAMARTRSRPWRSPAAAAAARGRAASPGSPGPSPWSGRWRRRRSGGRWR